MLRTCSLLGPQSLRTSCTSATLPLAHTWHKPATSRDVSTKQHDSQSWTCHQQRCFYQTAWQSPMNLPPADVSTKQHDSHPWTCHQQRCFYQTAWQSGMNLPPAEMFLPNSMTVRREPATSRDVSTKQHDSHPWTCHQQMFLPNSMTVTHKPATSRCFYRTAWQSRMNLPPADVSTKQHDSQAWTCPQQMFLPNSMTVRHEPVTSRCFYQATWQSGVNLQPADISTKQHNRHEQKVLYVHHFSSQNHVIKGYSHSFTITRDQSVMSLLMNRE